MPDTLEKQPGTRTIPLALVADYNALGTEFVPWGPEVAVTQKMVDVFTEISGDTNVIHTARPDVQTIVPGLMVTSLLPRLLPGGLPLSAPNRTMINLGLSVHFTRPVHVDTPMQMRYRALRLECDFRGSIVTFEFEIAVHHFQRLKVASSGEISILVRSE